MQTHKVRRSYPAFLRILSLDGCLFGKCRLLAQQRRGLSRSFILVNHPQGFVCKNKNFKLERIKAICNKNETTIIPDEKYSTPGKHCTQPAGGQEALVLEEVRMGDPVLGNYDVSPIPHGLSCGLKKSRLYYLLSGLSR